MDADSVLKARFDAPRPGRGELRTAHDRTVRWDEDGWVEIDGEVIEPTQLVVQLSHSLEDRRLLADRAWLHARIVLPAGRPPLQVRAELDDPAQAEGLSRYEASGDDEVELDALSSFVETALAMGARWSRGAAASEPPLIAEREHLDEPPSDAHHRELPEPQWSQPPARMGWWVPGSILIVAALVAVVVLPIAPVLALAAVGSLLGMQLMRTGMGYLDAWPAPMFWRWTPPWSPEPGDRRGGEISADFGRRQTGTPGALLLTGVFASMELISFGANPDFTSVFGATVAILTVPVLAALDLYDERHGLDLSIPLAMRGRRGRVVSPMRATTRVHRTHSETTRYVERDGESVAETERKDFQTISPSMSIDAPLELLDAEGRPVSVQAGTNVYFATLMCSHQDLDTARPTLHHEVPAYSHVLYANDRYLSLLASATPATRRALWLRLALLALHVGLPVSLAIWAAIEGQIWRIFS